MWNETLAIIYVATEEIHPPPNAWQLHTIHAQRGQAGDTLYCYVSKLILYSRSIWRIYGHLPNSSMFPPAKVSLHKVMIC